MSDDRQLANELASLRMQREAAPAGRSGGLPRWLITLGVVAVIGGGSFVLFTRTEQQLFPEEVELGAITLVSPAQEDVTLVATGYVHARKKATIAPKVTGRLARLFVDEGSVVKEGQLVGELESSDAQAQIAQVKAEIVAARARVERSRADITDAETRLAREQKLLAGAAGTQAAVDDARMRMATSKAQIHAAEAEAEAVQARLAAAQIALENTKVRAPFSGTVVRKLAEVGEVIPLGGAGAGLVTIADLANLEVEADVSEAQLIKVKVSTPGEILLDAFPDRRFRGEVREIRQTVDRAKASVTVKVRFKDDPSGVLPDMAAKVSFLARALDDAALKLAPKLVAPPDAVVDRGGRKVVLVVEDGRLRELPVVAGGAVGTMIELTSGPASGTRVVRRPATKLRDGSSVKEKGK